MHVTKQCKRNPKNIRRLEINKYGTKQLPPFEEYVGDQAFPQCRSMGKKGDLVTQRE